MGKITEIKKLKHLYKMELDGFDTLNQLYVCEDTIVHFMLSKDKILSEADLTKLSNFDAFAQGKARALYYLSFKARTTAEVKKYLRQHAIPETQLTAILTNLSENNLVNDQSYAENFVQGKLAMANAGPFLIRQKLSEKGIDAAIIDEVLAENYSEERQVELAIKLAEKYVNAKGGQYSFNQLKQKIIQFLTNKGFSYSIAKQALDELALENDEETEQELLAAELEKAVKKYSRRYEGYELRKHLTQALARKGFDFDEISTALRDYDFDE